MIRAALAGLLVAAVVGADASILPPLDAYRLAVTRGELGSVTGRIYAERPRPSAPDTPLAGVAVTLVPHSEGLVAAVESVKANARNSMRDYRHAVTTMRDMREAYELALWNAGAAEFVRSEVTSTAGTFSITAVPAGRWLVLARRETADDRSWRRPAVRERDVFLPGTELTGVRTVYLWLVPVAVEAGRVVDVELTDRSVWFTGIEEEKKGGTVR